MKENEKEKEKEKESFKIITLGDSFVGKTTLLKKYVYNIFDENISNTVGMNITFKDITLKNNEKISLKLVDTAGTEKYKSISKQYFKNADGVLFMFSHDNIESFEHITSWMDIYNQSGYNEKNVPKCLIGNKNDLELNVGQEAIDEFLKNNEDFIYKSVSAKNDTEKINILFQEFGEKIYEESKKYKDIKGKTIKISSEKKKEKRKCVMKCLM